MGNAMWTAVATGIAIFGICTTSAAQSVPKAPAGKKAAPVSRATAPKKSVKSRPVKNKPAKKQKISDCPPGAVCETQDVAPPKGAVPGGERNEMGAETNDGDSGDQQGTAIVLPPDGRGTDPNRPRTFTYLPDPNGGPGRIIAHDPDAVADDALFSEPPPRRHRKRRRRRRWGVNVRLNALLLPEFRERGDEVGMGGVGMSVRYRPTRRFAVDLGGDFMAGTDSNGLRRQEIPISASGLVYINPRSRVQVYVLGGLHWSFARVQSDVALPHLSEGTSDQYSYIGGQLGAGVEFRVSRLVGIDLDGLAFVRTRTDDARQDDFPEYYDPDTGESSNSSAAGVFRVGATFWW